MVSSIFFLLLLLLFPRLISAVADWVYTILRSTHLTRSNQLVKFADDTYLIIPASNVDSRSAEVDNIETWASTNNMTLNRTKAKEIIFVDTRRKRQVVAPPALPGIVRVTSLNILNVTMTNGLSACDACP